MDETTPMTELMDLLGRDKNVDANFRRVFLEDSRLEATDALRAIIAAYDKAVADGVKLPTMLMCAIECARAAL